MSESLRVGYDATALLGSPTGVGNFTRQALEALSLQDEIDLTVYGLTWRGRQQLGSLVPNNVTISAAPMAARPLRHLWKQFDIPPIEWWTGSIDVVHGTNFVVPPTRRARALVTVHDLTCIRFPEMCTPDTLEYPNLLRRALDRGAHVHAVSQFVADEVIELLGASPDRVHVVHHGVPDVIGGSPERGRAIARGVRYVLSLGTIEPRKDLVTLVRAFDAIANHDPEILLVIAGPDGWGTAALDDAISTATHRQRIRRLGWVSNSDRAALLAGATVFAYPSIYEGFGFPPLEAMSVGIPVVTTSAGALPEVLGDAAVFATPGSSEELSECLYRLIEDEMMHHLLIERGRIRSSSYSWKGCSERLIATYRLVRD